MHCKVALKNPTLQCKKVKKCQIQKKKGTGGGFGSGSGFGRRGGSAGGLLMGAVINMAPDMFKGVLAAVPFVDVVTTIYYNMCIRYHCKEKPFWTFLCIFIENSGATFSYQIAAIFLRFRKNNR